MVLERVTTLREYDCNGGTSFCQWYFITITDLQFISIKVTLVHGILGPRSDWT